MLVETNFKIGDTISMKLLSGEEIVSRYQRDDETDIVVEKPMLLAASHSGIGLMPYMYTVSPHKPVSIKKSSIISLERTQEDMAREYLAQTTGIQL